MDKMKVVNECYNYLTTKGNFFDTELGCQAHADKLETLGRRIPRTAEYP